MPFVGSIAGAAGFGRIPAGANSYGGSIYLVGNSSTNLSVPNDADFRFGTGDFTVEWFYYQTANGGVGRVFSLGSFPSATLAFSIQSGSAVLYVNGTDTTVGSIPVVGQFNHYAVCRNGSDLRVFLNGVQLGSTITSSDDLNNTADVLCIGNESSVNFGTTYVGGFLTNFRWIKGTALYTTSTFVVPTVPLTAVSGTKLLLLATDAATIVDDSSGEGKVVTNNGGTWSAQHP
jgi:hypothetical protein